MSHDPNAKMEDLVKEGDDLDLVVVKTNDQEEMCIRDSSRAC